MTDASDEQARAAAERLLPCPFCGGEAEVGGYTFSWFARCMAHECWAAVHGSLYQEINDAIAAWNRRSLPPPGAGNWREIETAPKDGSRILAELEDGEGIEIIEWEADGWKGPGWVHSTGKWSAFPIRWWPLPASSKEKSNG